MRTCLIWLPPTILQNFSHPSPYCPPYSSPTGLSPPQNHPTGCSLCLQCYLYPHLSSTSLSPIPQSAWNIKTSSMPTGIVTKLLIFSFVILFKGRTNTLIWVVIVLYYFFPLDHQLHKDKSYTCHIHLCDRSPQLETVINLFKTLKYTIFSKHKNYTSITKQGQYRQSVGYAYETSSMRLTEFFHTDCKNII